MCIRDRFRPGPMANIPAYIARKKGEEPVTYPLDCLKPILSSTYGIIIYLSVSYTHLFLCLFTKS